MKAQHKEKQSKQNSVGMSQKQLGNQLSFAGKESYKLLRTNLAFCLPNKEGCSVIGVTSSVPAEGKSTTAVNLAYTLSETGSRVCVMEADMRLPHLADRLQGTREKGLSNLLSGQASGNDVLQKISFEHTTFYAVFAGTIPPNPSELLASKQMEAVMEALRKSFDYIILDLPPVTSVSDALVVSKLLDGMIVVVRQDYASKKALEETMRKLKLSNVNILGFTMTHSTTQQKTYRKRYGYYKSYEKEHAKS